MILFCGFQEPAYNPQVEAISPTLPNEESRQDVSPFKSTKDELLANINRIDREISQTEAQISKLTKRQVVFNLTSLSYLLSNHIPNRDLYFITFINSFVFI